MLVLHAFWTMADGPGLWAEDTSKSVNSTSQAVKSARPHPFAAEPVQLEALAVRGEAGVLELLLPSLKRAPLDSPQLIRVEARRASKAHRP